MIRKSISALSGLFLVPGIDYHLLPAMTLRLQVVMVTRVPAGEGVSYGHAWHTEWESHADAGPVVGRVYMDQVMVDCGDDLAAEGVEDMFFGTGEGRARVLS